MTTREKARRLVELDGKATEDSSSLTDAEWKEFQHLSTDQLSSIKIARKLIEALDVIKEMCDSAERYAAHANAHPERDHSAAMASVAERVVTAGTLFLARLDEKEDADNG